jgi:pantoate--beta-alanine ligase
MLVIRDLSHWREQRASFSGSVGFVPTMGALHAGHCALLQASVTENDWTVLSIYVNPTQFNNDQDLDSYPQSLDEDLTLAEQAGVDVVLLPAYADLYPDDYRYRVEENEFSRELCGAHRPGHFTGVLTVVMKLLNLVQASRAYFGEKDYQQYLLVREMTAAFFIDTEIIACQTVRESDGLAMSSRNRRLGECARAQVALFSQALRSCADDAAVVERLNQAGFKVDYVVTSHQRRFGAIEVSSGEHSVRLIDNVPMSEVVR